MDGSLERTGDEVSGARSTGSAIILELAEQVAQRESHSLHSEPSKK